MYLAGYDFSPGNNEWRVEARNLSNGSSTWGTPLAIQDTPVTLGLAGAAFRLRMLLSVSTGSLVLSDKSLNLQFTSKNAGTCASSTGWANVTTSTAISYYNNPTPTDGAALIANANDPTHNADVLINQTFEESNPFTNSVAPIPVNQDGKWDFSLFDNGAPASTDYCLQAVVSSSQPLDAYNYYPEIMTASTIMISAVSISPNPINLTGYPTTTVTVNATVADNNGCSDITGGTTTILLYRSSVTSSSCLSGSGNGVSTNLNCYTASAFTASSSCIGSQTSINTTTTFGMYYFAQATDASSSYPSNTWKATVMFKGAANATGTADSTATTTLNTLLAMTLTTSSLNYGAIASGGNTSSTNQTTGINNAGNCSTTIKVAGQTLLTSSTVSLTVGSQHFSTSSFVFPGTSTALSASSTPFSLVILTAPTSTASSSYTQTTWWGLQVASGTPPWVYNGSNIFSETFHT
jgi:hypothetical protein